MMLGSGRNSKEKKTIRLEILIEGSVKMSIHQNLLVELFAYRWNCILMVLLKFYICSTSNMFDSLMLIPFHIRYKQIFHKVIRM